MKLLYDDDMNIDQLHAKRDISIIFQVIILMIMFYSLWKPKIQKRLKFE